jgi:hypothetical protein
VNSEERRKRTAWLVVPHYREAPAFECKAESPRFWHHHAGRPLTESRLRRSGKISERCEMGMKMRTSHLRYASQLRLIMLTGACGDRNVSAVDRGARRPKVHQAK